MHTFFLGPPGGGAAGSGALAGFTIPIQEQTQWCWAAVSVGVALHYASATWKQCEVAKAQFPALNCCGADAGGGCNQPWYLDRALGTVGHFGHLVFSDVTFALVQGEIGSDRPLGCRIQWVGGVGAHFVAIGGWSQDDKGTQYLEIHDPFYGFVQIVYNDFRVSYRSPGDTWTHTYFTTAAPAVAAAAGGGPAIIHGAPLSA